VSVRLDAALLAAIVLGYAVLGLAILAPEGVYSGDIGVKYVQARALADSGFGSLDIPYPGGVLDPERRLFPLRPPFIITLDSSTQAIFSPVGAVLQAVATPLLGIKGMVLVAIASGCVILAAASVLVTGPARIPLLVALGIGSPLWFYVVTPWEHAPAVALGTVAFALAWRSDTRVAPVLAGLAIGAGATMRDEVLLLLPGVLLALWQRRHSWRALVAAAVATLIPLAGAAAVEVLWFGRPPAVHLRHAVHIVQVAASLTGEPNPEVPSLTPFTLRDRYDAVVQYWLAGSIDLTGTVVLAALWTAALAVWWRRRNSMLVVISLVVMIAIALADVAEVVMRPKWPAGLVHVAPYLALALLPAPAGAPPDPLPRAVLLTAAIYLIVAFAGVDTTGGKSLGPRLLLPLVPLLTAAAVIRHAQYRHTMGGNTALIGHAGFALLALAVVLHMGGTIPAYIERNEQDAKTVLRVAAAPERIVVSDDPFTVQMLFPLYYEKLIYLADTPERAARIGALLAASEEQRAIFVTRDPVPWLRLAPFHLDRGERVGRMIVQYWMR
jgi:hypothetical protein